MNNMEVAFHEAGHIVMTMLWGVWQVDKVSIPSRGKSGGGIEYARITETERKKLRRRLGTRFFDAKLERMMGGPLAQAILRGGKAVYQGRKGDTDFDAIVSEIQNRSAGSSLAKAWEMIYEHEPVVQADLKRMWPVVEALANELISQKELSDHQIRSIVRTVVNQLPENERIWAISRLRNTSPGS